MEPEEFRERARHLEHRVFCGWEAGWYITSLDDDFSRDFPAMVLEYGPPDLVEFRAHGEGWTSSPGEDE